VYVVYVYLCVADRWSSLDGEQFLVTKIKALDKWDQQNQKDKQEHLDQGKYSI